MLSFPLLFTTLCATCEDRPESGVAGPFGLRSVIAYYGEGTPSQNFVRGGNWRDWVPRGGIVSQGVVHHSFLRESVDKASDFLAGLDFGGNPNPVIDIDELGWDYDGGIDHHAMAILRATHEKRPDLKIAVWQMRGPVAPLIASVYRDTVEMVMMETYTDLNDAWMIAFQLQAARLNGLLDRSVVAIGLGSESKDLGGSPWTRTREELEQQVHLIRFVAPESPGVAFFGKWKLKEDNAPLTDDQIEEFCSEFQHIPTDGRHLKPDLYALGETFKRQYEKPAIFCSSFYVFPDFHSGHDGGPWGQPQDPPVARVLMLNQGRQAAGAVKVRLRDIERGAWAEGTVDLPARSVVVAVLPILPGTGFWGWGGTSVMEVTAPGCEVFNFQDYRNRK
jgi:hypothetical protein